MDFYQALLSQRKPQRMALGGAAVGSQLGSAAMGPLGALYGASAGYKNLGNGNLQDIGNAISDGWKQTIAPNQFVPNMPQNTWSPEQVSNNFSIPQMPTNNFRAVAPDINEVGYEGAMRQGMGGVDQGTAGMQQAFAQQMAIADQAGQSLGNQQNLYGQQQGLADALLAQSRGQGPNPAQLQFRQNMDQAIAQQAGATASARGINPALAARMGAQQGAAMMQGGAGQAAVLQAQQQLAAQQALAQQQQAMGQNLLGQNSTIAGQGNLYGAAANTAGNIGSLGANIYGTAVGGNNAQNNTMMNASLGAQGLNASVAQQNADLAAKRVALQADQAKQNADLAMQRQGLIGGVKSQNAQLGAQGEALKAGVASGNAATQTAVVGGLLNAAGGAAGKAVGAAHGGEIDAKALNLADALMSRGGDVPGKAKVKGDSSENDVVPTVLSPKEIVLPRSVTLAEDAPEKAAEFVAKLKGKSGSGAKGYGKVLEKHRELQSKMKELEALIKRVS